MACTEVQKVQFSTHMLEEEAKDWLNNACKRMEIVGTQITWVVFRATFLEKYFPEDVGGKKVIELLELKQGNLIVVKYAAKFEEVVKFCPYYNNLAAEVSKCIKLENGLRPKIKQGIGYQEVLRFLVLVNKCKLFYEDSKAKSSYYKNLSEKKGKGKFRGKSYVTPTNKGKQEATSKEKPSGGGDPTSVQCCRCCVIGLMPMSVLVLRRSVTNAGRQNILFLL